MSKKRPSHEQTFGEPISVHLQTGGTGTNCTYNAEVIKVSDSISVEFNASRTRLGKIEVRLTKESAQELGIQLLKASAIMVSTDALLDLFAPEVSD